MSIFGILVILLGVVYGYSRKGTEDYWSILKNGVMIGVVIGVIVSIIGFLIGGLFLGIPGGLIGGMLAGSGAFMFIISIVFITIEFVIGAFIGDILEKVI